MARHPSREELVTGLIRLGEQELTGEDEAEVDACFAPDFAFHGPDGAEMDYEGLKGYFASLRAAFDDLTIKRGIVIVERDYVACQTTITGTFAREFTHSPVGPLPPNGRRIVFELMNIFRYDEQGRLAEEWVQTDNRSRPRQLGAEGRRAAPEVTPALVCAIRALQHSREPWMERRWQAEATAMPARSAPLVAGVWRAVAPGLRPVVAA